MTGSRTVREVRSFNLQTWRTVRRSVFSRALCQLQLSLLPSGSARSCCSVPAYFATSSGAGQGESEASSAQSLCTGRFTTEPLARRMEQVRTTLSLPGNNSSTLPNFHDVAGAVSSCKSTTSPTRSFVVGHVGRLCADRSNSRYARFHLFQSSAVTRWR